MPGDPHSGSKFWKALGRDFWQHRSRFISWPRLHRYGPVDIEVHRIEGIAEPPVPRRFLQPIQQSRPRPARLVCRLPGWLCRNDLQHCRLARWKLHAADPAFGSDSILKRTGTCRAAQIIEVLRRCRCAANATRGLALKDNCCQLGGICRGSLFTVTACFFQAFEADRKIAANNLILRTPMCTRPRQAPNKCGWRPRESVQHGRRFTPTPSQASSLRKQSHLSWRLINTLTEPNKSGPPGPPSGF
jgi:hypothetical protein